MSTNILIEAFSFSKLNREWKPLQISMFFIQSSRFFFSAYYVFQPFTDAGYQRTITTTTTNNKKNPENKCKQEVIHSMLDNYN